jgi:ribosomal protein S18 acetylase RimI-like enzyme
MKNFTIIGAGVNNLKGASHLFNAQNLYRSLGFIEDQEFLSFYNNTISNPK